MSTKVKAEKRTGNKRIRRATRSRHHIADHRLIVCLTVIAIFFALSFSVMSGFISSAQGSPEETPVTYKYYKTIPVEHGDTLWDIAEEYKTDDYASTADYVDALKRMNHLSGDTIYAGDRIMIAYNDTEFH